MNVTFNQVSFYYVNKLPERKPVLHNISFEIKNNEFIGLIGPSGSGKTTLIQHFTGLLQPNDGKVLIDNVDLAAKNSDLELIRRKIGIVFQFPESQLFEETVLDDVAFGPKNYGLSDELVLERVQDTFKLIGLDFDKIKSRSPFKLSEGEKRRVALAGVLSMNPEMLILDEPTACLDPIGIQKIEQLLTNLHQIGKSILIVSHNLEFVAKCCARIMLLQQGKISYDGTKENFFNGKTDFKIKDLSLPRIIRYSRKLNELGYVSNRNIFSIDEMKKVLTV